MTQNNVLLDNLRAVADIGRLQGQFQINHRVGVPGVIEYENTGDDFSRGLLEGLALAHFYAKEALRRIAANSGLVVVVDPATLEEIQEVMDEMEEEHGCVPDEFEDYLEEEHGMRLGDVVVCKALLEV